MIQNEIRSGQLARPHLVPPPSQVHRDPGVKHQPYLYINDPLNDSSGDQGNFLKDYINYYIHTLGILFSSFLTSLNISRIICVHFLWD